MPKIQLEVIPEPKPGTAAVLVLTAPNMATSNPYAVLSSDGATDYVCGACRAVLAASVNRGQVTGLVLKCLKCGSFNEIRGSR